MSANYLLDGAAVVEPPPLSLFGDGVFESLLLVDGRAHLQARHLRRLCEGAVRLGLAFNHEYFQSDIQTVVDHYSLHKGCYRLRYALVRALTETGYAVDQAAVQRLLSVRKCPYPGHSQLSLNVSDIRLPLDPQLAGIKHCNRLPQILARQQLANGLFDESVMLDANDSVVECIAANLFVLEGDSLVTPALTQSGVAGVMRDFVMDELAARSGLSSRSEALPLLRLLHADALFITNALTGIRQVRQLIATPIDGSQKWAEHPKVRELQNAVMQSVAQAGGG